MIKRYVSRTGVPFLAVEYRLAPEVRAPVPITDTYAGLKYLVQNANELGVDPSRIGIMVGWHAAGLLSQYQREEFHAVADTVCTNLG